ncbi:MAG: AGE family epimerase/isomerase [Alphaproteobacteria bacterium]
MVAIPETTEAWQRWLALEVMPWWAATAVSQPAGYVEYLTPEGVADRRPAKTPLTTARLVYSFAHAAALGLGEGSLAAAEHGFRFLTTACWDAGEGGFFHQVAADGAPLAREKDAYDHAFALLACAWLHRASGAQRPLVWAARIADFMDAVLLDRQFGGYRERHLAGSADRLPRRQNPHMHLLEAYLALYEATGDKRWRARAEAMVEHFQAHFFDAASGTLGEYFTADWRAAPGAAGGLREPGHHFEWVWLLHHYIRLTGDERVREPAERLYRFACEHGLEYDRHFVPAAFDEVDRNGRTVATSKLLWPQTEAIQAHLARWEFLRDTRAAEAAKSHLAVLFGHYLIDGKARWRNQLARDGRELSSELPVRVFYHLFLCFAELLRLWPTLPAPHAGPHAATAEALSR